MEGRTGSANSDSQNWTRQCTWDVELHGKNGLCVWDPDHEDCKK